MRPVTRKIAIRQVRRARQKPLIDQGKLAKKMDRMAHTMGTKSKQA